MIERILEPEYMDTPEEATDYDSMDHSHVNRVFAADFIVIWPGRGPILDLGTGTAQIPIEFCRQSSQGEVLAIDAAQHMLDLAQRNIDCAGFSKRIKVQKVDAKGLPFADGQFAAVMSNSIIHHIPEPGSVFGELARVAAPGATILVRDLLRPGSIAEIQRLVDLYAAGANDHQRLLFFNSLHAALTLEEVRQLVKAVGYQPECVSQTTDRHWTWAVPGQ